MGYLAGIIDKKGEDASDRLLRMLRVASKGTAYSYGVANRFDVENYRDPPDFTSITGSTLVGSKNIHVESPESPLHQGSHSFVFKGLLYDNDDPDSLVVANHLKDNPIKGLRKLVTEKHGMYSVVIVDEKGIVCGLDHIGLIPLYYGENKDHCAVATNKKML